MGGSLALLFVTCFALIARSGRADNVIPHIVLGDTFGVKDSSGGADPAGRSLTVVAKEPQRPEGGHHRMRRREDRRMQHSS